jgi:hypothetical protein
MQSLHSQLDKLSKWKQNSASKPKVKLTSLVKESIKPGKRKGAKSVEAKDSKASDASSPSKTGNKPTVGSIFPSAAPTIVTESSEQLAERMADLVDLDRIIEEMALDLENDSEPNARLNGQISKFPLEEWEVATLNVSDGLPMLEKCRILISTHHRILSLR